MSVRLEVTAPATGARLAYLDTLMGRTPLGRVL